VETEPGRIGPSATMVILVVLANFLLDILIPIYIRIAFHQRAKCGPLILIRA
jgi:hypothetical protein